MEASITRRAFLAASAAAAAGLSLTGLSGCGSTEEEASVVRFGTMPTEDSLPMWVAAENDLFTQMGLTQVEIVPFDSAQALSAAITAGEVDIAMTDPMRAVKLCESGTSVTMEWITLGTEPSQGRFGVLVAGESAYESLADIVADAADRGQEWGVGVGANTVPEYVLDRLCEQEGISATEIPTVEVASLPDRYSMVASGQLPAAALPASMLALGEANGMCVLIDDTQGENISQSVMVARVDYVKECGRDALDKVVQAWDAAADLINANPDSCRDLLVQHANLNEDVARSYEVSEYPKATLGHPAAALIDPQLAWMGQKGYVSGTVSYSEETGAIEIG